jgi:hypothetical protein
MRTIRRRLLFTAVTAFACLALGQTSAKTWLGHAPEMERHLKTAQITRVAEKPFASMTWKVLPPGRRDGYWESYKSEIAAYELDKLLRLDMVPPAVERALNGETGAAVMWIDGVKSVKQTGGKVPSGPAWDKPIRRMLMFDNLIGNPDRNAGNILIGLPGELILIDHSRAFTDDRELPRKLPRVDGALWDRMQAVTPEDLSRTLSPWMDGGALTAVLERRKQMIASRPQIIR